MKKASLKESNRKTKGIHLDNNNAHSHSPPHKKLLKKLVGNQNYNPKVNSDCSLQNQLIYTQSKEETRDFRAEIERRYKKSLVNRNYCFPLHKTDFTSSCSSSSSEIESMEFLQYVTVYDLASQNGHIKHQKSPKKSVTCISQAIDITNNQNQNFGQQLQTSREETYNHSKDSTYEDSDIQLETLIRDKNSSLYKNLIRSLEANSTFSHNFIESKQEKPIQKETQRLLGNREIRKTQVSDNFDRLQKSYNKASPNSRNLETQLKNHVGSVYHSKVDISSAAKNHQRMKQRSIKSELDSIHSKTNTTSQMYGAITTQNNNKVITGVAKVSSNDTLTRENRALGVNESLNSLRSEPNSKKSRSYDKNQNNRIDLIPSLGEGKGKSRITRNFQSNS